MVCFPSRSHLPNLKLMPKPICSPARVNEPKRHHPHHLKKLTSNGHASPLLWVKPSNSASTNNKMEKTGSSRCGVVSEEEPTSPKVTCAGQIKVRPTTTSSNSNSNKACRNWQSVMEEIERIHNNSTTTRTRKKQKKTKKGSTTTASIGYVMQFVTCLRSISFDFRCLRPFPEITSVSDDDDGEDEEDDDGNHSSYSNKNSCCKTPVVEEAEEGGSSAVFSKWFMVLQENHQQQQGHEIGKAEYDNQKKNEKQRKDEEQAVPPPNALLLMRCRSAPATAHGRTISTSDLEEIKKQVPPQEEEQLQTQQADKEEETKRENPVESEEQGAKFTKRIRRRRQTLAFVMQNDTDFINRPFSTSHSHDPDITNIAKETWLTVDPFSRSKSWRR